MAELYEKGDKPSSEQNRTAIRQMTQITIDDLDKINSLWTRGNRKDLEP